MHSPRCLILILFLPITALAQFSKGDKMVGTTIASVVVNSGTADITVSSIGENTSKINTYNIAVQPSIGWFLSEQTVFGAGININPTGNTTTYEQGGNTYQKDKMNTFDFGVGVFARHYLNGKNLLPFAQIALNGGIASLKTSGFLYAGSGVDAYKQTYSGKASGAAFINATIMAGITKMVGEKTGLDFFIGYSYSYNKSTFNRTTLKDIGNNGSIDETLKNETITKYTIHGFQLGIGFQVFLKRSK